MKKLLLLTVIALLSFALLSCSKSVSPVSDFKYRKTSSGVIIKEYIGNSAEVVIPDKIDGGPVVEIGMRAFIGKKIQSVTVPEGVKKIGEFAFSGCKELTSVELPEGLEVIDIGAFNNCTALNDIDLPDTLTSLGTEAFYECTSLKYIYLPGNITDFGSKVFGLCGLEEIEFSDKLKVLGYNAFGCTKVKSVEIPGSVEVIPGALFYFCDELETVILNDGLKEIEGLAFDFCANLKSITIPASVEKLAESAIENCLSLGKVVFEGNAPEIDPVPEVVYSIEDGQPIKKTKSEKITVYYHEGAEGFGETWNGYKTQVW